MYVNNILRIRKIFKRDSRVMRWR